MKKKIFLLFSVICIMLCLVGCQNVSDEIDIYYKSTAVFDNYHIKIKDGYFYDSHEKFTVDENTIGVTIYFTTDEIDEWNNNPSKNNK